MPDADDIKYVPINELHREPGARELSASPDMEPYLNFAAPRPGAGTRSDSPVAPRRTVCLVVGVGAQVGLRRFRQSHRQGRQGDIDAGRFRQGDRPTEIAAYADGFAFEGAGGY
jgi:hypothetical protein